jgi:death on curing protein
LTQYISLAEFLYVAERVLEIDVAILEKGSRIHLADSALHAPSAGFGDQEFYPDLTDKAAVLCAHLTWNHALPDGNKRTAWLVTLLFIVRNGGTYDQGVFDAEAVDVMVALADHEIDEHALADWLRQTVRWSMS